MAIQSIYIIGIVLLIVGTVSFIFLTKKKDDVNPNLNPNPNPKRNGEYIVNPNFNSNCWSDPSSCQRILASQDSGIQERLKCLKYKGQLNASECDELEDADNYDDGCEDEYRNFYDSACKNVVDPINRKKSPSFICGNNCDQINNDPKAMDCYMNTINANRNLFQKDRRGNIIQDPYTSCHDQCVEGDIPGLLQCETTCTNACHRVLSNHS